MLCVLNAKNGSRLAEHAVLKADCVARHWQCRPTEGGESFAYFSCSDKPGAGLSVSRSLTSSSCWRSPFDFTLSFPALRLIALCTTLGVCLSKSSVGRIHREPYHRTLLEPSDVLVVRCARLSTRAARARGPRARAGTRVRVTLTGGRYIEYMYRGTSTRVTIRSWVQGCGDISRGYSNLRIRAGGSDPSRRDIYDLERNFCS